MRIIREPLRFVGAAITVLALGLTCEHVAAQAPTAYRNAPAVRLGAAHYGDQLSHTIPGLAPLRGWFPFDTTIPPTVPQPDSSLSVMSCALQLAAAEVAFNATSFALFGDEMYKSQSALGIIGIVASWFTVPVAIHATTSLLGLRRGSLGGSIIGACIASSGVASLALHWNLPTTYLANYLVLSIPVVTFAILFYDLSIL